MQAAAFLLLFVFLVVVQASRLPSRLLHVSSRIQAAPLFVCSLFAARRFFVYFVGGVACGNPPESCGMRALATSAPAAAIAAAATAAAGVYRILVPRAIYENPL